MGMDIYFQAYDANDAALGPRQEIRCRDIYHAVNDWCAKHDRDTPDNGERVSFDAAQWSQVAPRVAKAIAEADLALAGSSVDEAQALGQRWLQDIWPAGTQRVEYWFTV